MASLLEGRTVKRKLGHLLAGFADVLDHVVDALDNTARVLAPPQHEHPAFSSNGDLDASTQPCAFCGQPPNTHHLNCPTLTEAS